jgi:organic radical activating enzyme
VEQIETKTLKIRHRRPAIKDLSDGNQTLNVSEHFYSVQGEGHSTGVPAYFIRLRGCNLMCGGRDGRLVKSGEATWWCDTEYVWRKGKQTSFDSIIKAWEDENILEWVLQGRVHVIWTGGEPTLSKHQRDIVAFLDYLQEKYHEKLGVFKVCYNEIETNGTLHIDADLFDHLDQINCSVKLANSGMPLEKRRCAAGLQRIMEHHDYWFKFVISNEEDLEEIKEDFVRPFNIPPHRVLMMPGLDSRKDYHERTRFCLEMAKKYGYTGLTRLHVSAWDKTTGV